MQVELFRRTRRRAALPIGLPAFLVVGVVVGLAATASAATKPPPNLTPQERALFQYAACMRSKGVNIPDPVKKNGTYAFPTIPAKVLNTPGVREKARACAAQLPRTGPGGQGGSVLGPITSVNGATFTLKTQASPTGKSTVSVGSARITREITALPSSLKVGVCVAVNGTRNSKGVVAADRISISAPVNGRCGGGFAVRGGGPGRLVPSPGSQGGAGQRPPGPGGGQQPPGAFGGNGNFGFAVGTVTEASGSTITVKGSFGQTARATVVTISSKTALQRTIGAKATAIKVGLCAFVQGTSSDKGVTVKATRIALAPETNGTCTFR